MKAGQKGATAEHRGVRLIEVDGEVRAAVPHQAAAPRGQARDEGMREMLFSRGAPKEGPPQASPRQEGAPPLPSPRSTRGQEASGRHKV
eukprot:9586938-Alexandrium_andersonii.AAC.1